MKINLKISKPFSNYFKNPTNKVFKQRRFDMEFEKERKEFQVKYKEAISKIKETYWKDQNKMEVDYIEYFNFVEGNLLWKNQSKDRRWMVIQSYKCVMQMKETMENQKKFMAKQKIWKIEDEEKHEEQQALLTLLDKQAENWLTPFNFTSKISNLLDLILPPTIGSHQDYYNKINKYALMVEEGKLEEAEEFKRQDLNQDFKNSLLEPIFVNLKKMIRSVTSSPEHGIYEEYKTVIHQLKTKIDVTKGKGKEIMSSLTEKYKDLIINSRKENEEANLKIALIENTLTAITSLLITWERYVDILYSSNEELNKIQSKMRKNLNPDYKDLPYAGNLALIDDDLNSIETLLGVSNQSLKMKNEIMNKLTDSDKKEAFMSLILKNEKEFDLKPREIKENKEETNEKQGENKENNENNEEKEEIHKLNEEKIKQIEEESYFSEKQKLEFDLDDASLLMDGILFKSTSLTQDSNETKNKIAKDDLLTSLIKKQNQYKDELEKKNLLTKNLDDYLNKEINKEKEYTVDINKIIELAEIEIIEEKNRKNDYFQENNLTSESVSLYKSQYYDRLVNKSKGIHKINEDFIKIDIYSESLLTYLEYSINESLEVKGYFNVSLVMKYFLNTLNLIEEDSLTPENKFKKRHFEKLISLIGHLPIKDSQNFKKIFDLHKEVEIDI